MVENLTVEDGKKSKERKWKGELKIENWKWSSSNVKKKEGKPRFDQESTNSFDSLIGVVLKEWLNPLARLPLCIQMILRSTNNRKYREFPVRYPLRIPSPKEKNKASSPFSSSTMQVPEENNEEL